METNIETPVNDEYNETLSEIEDDQTFSHNEEIVTSISLFITPDMLRVLAWAGILMMIHGTGVSCRIMAMPPNRIANQGMPPNGIANQGMPPNGIANQGMPPNGIANQGGMPPNRPNNVNGGDAGAFFCLLLFLFFPLVFTSGIIVHWFGIEWDTMDISSWFKDYTFHNLMFNCTPGQEPQQPLSLPLSLSILGPAEGCGMYPVFNHVLKLFVSAVFLLAVFCVGLIDQREFSPFQVLIHILAFVLMSALMQYGLGTEWHCFGDCVIWSMDCLEAMGKKKA